MLDVTKEKGMMTMMKKKAKDFFSKGKVKEAEDPQDLLVKMIARKSQETVTVTQNL